MRLSPATELQVPHMPNHKLLHLVLPLVLLIPHANADDEQLKERLEDKHAEAADHWVYNDIEAARAMAVTQNKPMFVTFRCVPCRDCKSFDAEVAGGSQLIKDFASREFICVRQVEMKNVDLSQFQFDYDLNWAAMFINADGTVYARYGTQSAAGADAYNSIEGLKATMERVLELHDNYPKNADELKGKLGKPKPYKTAMEMPGLPGSAARLKGQTTKQNCIHCHMLHDAEHDFARQQKKFDRGILWRYPLPENIGISVDAKDGRTVTKLHDACRSLGVKVGDEISHVDGQAITSVADIQWVLHNLPNEKTTVTVKTLRDGEPLSYKVETQADWKKTDVSWRGSIFSFSPRTYVWCPPLPEKKRKQLKLERNQNALEVRWINTGKAGGRAARESGLQQGDVILEVDGKAIPDTDAKFQAFIKLNYNVGQVLPLTVLRRGKRMTAKLKLVE